MVGEIISGLILLAGIVASHTTLKNSVATLRRDLDKHEDQTPSCEKRFHDFSLDIEKLKQREGYEKEIVQSILTPLVEKISLNLTDYVDIKVGVLTKEIEDIKLSNLEFKDTVRDFMKEFKEENIRTLKEFKADTMEILKMYVNK